MELTPETGKRLRRAILEIYGDRRRSNLRYGVKDFAADVGAPRTTASSWINDSPTEPIDRIEVGYLVALYDMDPDRVITAMGMTLEARAERIKSEGREKATAVPALEAAMPRL